jgi:hypothetical protein
MGLFEVNNTVTKLTTPPATDVEVSFGLAALVLLDKGDQASIKKPLKLRHAAELVSRHVPPDHRSLHFLDNHLPRRLA